MYTATSRDFKWFSLAEMRWGIVFTWRGKIFLYLGYHWYYGSPDRIFVVFPCMLGQHTRRIRERYRGVTSRSWPGSRPWYLANIWSDPGQIRGTFTSWWKAWLLYADDLVLLADSEADLQNLLFLVEKWCKKWRLDVNLSKTNILHVRNNRNQLGYTSFNWVNKAWYN